MYAHCAGRGATGARPHRRCSTHLDGGGEATRGGVEDGRVVHAVVSPRRDGGALLQEQLRGNRARTAQARATSASRLTNAACERCLLAPRPKHTSPTAPRCAEGHVEATHVPVGVQRTARYAGAVRVVRHAVHVQPHRTLRRHTHDASDQCGKSPLAPRPQRSPTRTPLPAPAGQTTTAPGSAAPTPRGPLLCCCAAAAAGAARWAAISFFSQCARTEKL